MSQAVYVYCIVRRARRPVSAGAPHVLPGAGHVAVDRLGPGLWLITAPVPLAQFGPGALEPALRDVEWVGTVALAHQAVVEHFVRQRGASVVPVKLFTMFSAPERARSAFEQQALKLQRVFERIDGCEEWGVRVTPGLLRRAVPRASKPKTGTAFLAGRKQARDMAAEAAQALAEAAERAFSSLSKLAREQRRRHATPEGGVATLLEAAFLVPLRRRSRFHSAAERIADEVARTGGQMTLTGPWPPYNFVAGEDGA
jgi:hypothetical protein